MLGFIPDFDGKDKTATIPWLDHVEQVAERTGNDLVEVGMSKLKGLTLDNISTVRKRRRPNMAQVSSNLNRKLFQCTLCICCYGSI